MIFSIRFSPDGNQIDYVSNVSTISPYEPGTALGLSVVKFSPSMQYMIAGFYDEKLRLINQMSWCELFCFDHSWEELTEHNSADVLNIY
jgi:hypothetical protein